MSLLRCIPALVWSVCLIFGFAVVPRMVPAEQTVFLQQASFLADRQPLFELNRPSPAPDVQRSSASLFAGRDGAGLFAPYPVRISLAATHVLPRATGSAVERIRHLIGQAEAGKKGYDAVQHGAKVKPIKRPTEMTIAEIYAWIDQTPGQQHAIGRYQFIPATLRRLVNKVGVEPEMVFSSDVQDRLADELLAEAGLYAFGKGDIGRHSFMNNLAKIWAGLPNSTGKSHYDGLAGNRATMTWAHFDAEMGRIFPG